MPLFVHGFVIAIVADFNLIALGGAGVVFALIYLNIAEKRGCGAVAGV
ncbi:MAG: hypothetical protein HUJ51_06430 [Eggerthellaceae bacterium]|nr:hypothetical protein [Eggerthellaceae bacterium]